MSGWIDHIKSVRKAHKGMSYKDAMKLAAKSYKSTGPSKSRKSCMKACKKSCKKLRKRGRGSKQWGGSAKAAYKPFKLDTPANSVLDPKESAMKGGRKRRKTKRRRKRKGRKTRKR